MTFTTLTQAQSNSLKLAIAELVYRTMQRVEDYRSYRTTVNELSRLSAAQLADMGLNRSMIKRAALDAVYGGEV